MLFLGRPFAFLSIYTRSSSVTIARRRHCFLVTSGLLTSSAYYCFASTTTTCTLGGASAVAAAAADTTSNQDGSMSWDTGYLNAEDAASLDAELMSSPGFSLEQLMELAGLSVAEAVYQVVPPSPPSRRPPPLDDDDDDVGKILIVCGPGNNGGDGLVAARHLVMFGYQKVIVVYPKQSSQPHFVNLVQQCRDVDIPVLHDMPSITKNDGYSAIVDSIFGFSFHGTLREPFATIMQQIKEAQENLGIVTFSVDIPSGWNVNGGDEAGTGFQPNVLISLTAPKLAAQTFQGRHFVGGRFLPPKLAKKYNIRMPPYPGVRQVMELSNKSWEEQYAAHLAEKESQGLSPTSCDDKKPKDESWQQQYDDYLAEKDRAELASFGTDSNRID